MSLQFLWGPCASRVRWKLGFQPDSADRLPGGRMKMDKLEAYPPSQPGWL